MISVVIPAYNAEQTLARCLDGLLAQTAPRGSYEIIVVDDGSTDATREIAQASASVRVLTQANRGAGAARNLGAQNARGEIVLFIDADSIPDSRWIEAMAAPFADPTVAGASGEKKTHQKTQWARFVQMEYDYRYDRIATQRTIDFVDSSTAAYRREVLIANGGFDETLQEAEDTDLSFRLAERGYRMVLIRDAVVYHRHPESLAEFLRRKYQYAVWRVVVYARHPRKAASDTRTPQTQKLQAVLAFALMPAALGVVVWSELAWVAALLLLLFIATTLPFAWYCWRHSPSIALRVPGTLLLAAYAGDVGAAVGFLRLPKAKFR